MEEFSKDEILKRVFSIKDKKERDKAVMFLINLGAFTYLSFLRRTSDLLRNFFNDESNK